MSLQRQSLLTFALLLTACNRAQRPTPQAAYDNAWKLLQSERLQESALETERGLAAAPAYSKLSWNLRLLRVENLLAQREPKKSQAALNEASPDERQFPEQAARYRLCQAHAALLLGDSAAAQTHLDQAQALAQSVQAPRLLAEIEFRRADLAIGLRDYDGARQHVLRVLEYANANSDRSLQMRATGQMGYLLLRAARYAEAILWFEQTRSQAIALDARTSEARVLGNLGNCYFRLGDLDKALPDLRESESRFAANGNRYERQIWLGNIANIEESKHEYDAAAADYARALAISRKLESKAWTATWLTNLATVAIDRGEWDAAERYNSEALLLKQGNENRTARAYSMVNAGWIAEGRNRHSDAAKTFRGVLSLPMDDLRPLLDAHAGLAQAYAGENRDSAAENEFQAATAVVARQQTALLDEEDKLTWFASLIHFYQQYVEFLMSRGKTFAALEVVQSSRGRVLGARLGDPSSAERLTAADLRKLAAKSASTLLIYWIAPLKSYAWAVADSGIVEYGLPAEADLRGLVSRYDAFVQQLHDPLSEAVPEGPNLYATLVAPARIKTAKVMLSPDGPLYWLNFATLPVNGATESHYWIEDAQISIVPSFGLGRASAPTAAPSLLLIGNPVTADADFPELAFAGQEITGIQQNVPGIRKVVYMRGQARPDAYVNAVPADFSWIHFAAHAASNQDEPLESAIVLSRESGAEYKLFARDIVKIPLHADLVTISACRSAGSKVYAGEGLVGFSWAFLKSGARHVIAGLWDVNDRSTAEIMTSIYGELAHGAAPPGALRSAQLAMVRSKGVFRKPYYWGPFEVFQPATM